MKRYACTLTLALALGATSVAAADPELKTDDDKTFYALGLVISKQLAAFKLTPAELEILKSGLTDGVLKRPEKCKLDEFGPKIQTLGQSRMTSGLADEKKKGKDYLAKIAEKPGIKKTGTGLLIETIKEGTGPSPKLEDNVKVNYRGTLIDGTFFDGTEKYGEPSTFKLSKTGLIGCWNEALTFMKVGGKAKVYCPPDLAYGDRPNGEIPAGATLLFDLELLEIVK